MKTTRVVLATMGLAATIGLGACCGNEEQLFVNVGQSEDAVSVVRAGRTARVGFFTRWSKPDFNSSTFDFVFNTLEGSTSGEGIVLSLDGHDLATDERVIIAVALPVSLRVGEEYTVGTAFNVDPMVGVDARSGPYDLQQSTRAEAAMTIATYSFPPGAYTTNYRAASVSGTVRVTSRARGVLKATLNLTFVDAAGNTAKVTGGLQANNERFRPSCFT